MRIGKQENAATSICTSDANSITVRGMDLCSEVIGHVDFTSYFWLLVTGQMPDDRQKRLADGVLCAIAEHGLVPSVVAARMTMAAAPEAFGGVVLLSKPINEKTSKFLSERFIEGVAAFGGIL